MRHAAGNSAKTSRSIAARLRIGGYLNKRKQSPKFYASGGVPLGPLPGLGCCAHEQLGGYVPVAGWLFHESSSCGVHVKSLLIAAAGTESAS